MAAVSGQVPETLHNIRTIRALGMEDLHGDAAMTGASAKATPPLRSTNFYDAIYSPVVLLLNAAVVGIVMLLSASGNAEVLALFGMSVGTSVAVINYISRIFAPIESLGMEIQTIQSAMAGVKRIDAFLAQPERDIPAEQRDQARPAGDVVLSARNLRLRREACAARLLHDREGRASRSRWSAAPALARARCSSLLLGLYKPEAGTDHHRRRGRFADISDRERRTCIGCVEQHFSRVPGTVLDQITLGDPQHNGRYGAERGAQLAGIDAAIQALAGRATIRVCTEGMFSQGEWQLLSIARAAAADPGGAAAGRDHSQSGRRDGGTRSGSPAPRL